LNFKLRDSVVVVVVVVVVVACYPFESNPLFESS
jgi:hypothetical protein